MDALLKSENFINSNVLLTNAKNAFSESLAEFVAYGMLDFLKKMSYFRKYKVQKEWKQLSVGMLKDQSVLIVGYGNIGISVARLLKQGFRVK